MEEARRSAFKKKKIKTSMERTSRNVCRKQATQRRNFHFIPFGVAARVARWYVHVFLYQKCQFLYTLKVAGMKKFGVFHCHLVFLWSYWYILPHFSFLYQKNLATLALPVPACLRAGLPSRRACGTQPSTRNKRIIVRMVRTQTRRPDEFVKKMAQNVSKLIFIQINT
jgi:hypothetical protein